LDSNELKELMQFISSSNFVEFEMEQEGFKLRLIKAGARPEPHLDGRPGQSAGSGQPGTIEPAQVVIQAEASAASSAQPVVTEKLHEIRSPIVGTFFRSPSPDAPAYVEVGDRVKKGQILCIVEAMKLMNEIESDVAGEIVQAFPSNGQPVEYGEVLFRIRPLGSG